MDLLRLIANEDRFDAGGVEPRHRLFYPVIIGRKNKNTVVGLVDAVGDLVKRYSFLLQSVFETFEQLLAPDAAAVCRLCQNSNHPITAFIILSSRPFGNQKFAFFLTRFSVCRFPAMLAIMRKNARRESYV